MKTKKQQKIAAPRSITRHFPQVKTIIDAKQPIIVHVNKKDCSDSTSLDPNECALAKAVKREFKADAAIIGLSSSYIIKGTKAIRFDTGEKIAREIVSFDRHHDFEPGTYKLTPKNPSRRLGTVHCSHGKGGKDNRERHDKATNKKKTYGVARVRLLSATSGSRA